MKVLSISTDINIFKEESAVLTRMMEYGSFFDEFHIIIFTKRSFSFRDRKFKGEKISSNVWIYPTNSWTKFHYIKDAVRLGNKIIKDRNFEKTNDVITVQDPFETGLVGLKLKELFSLPLHVQIHTDFLSPYFKNHSHLNKVRIAISRKVLGSANAVRVVSNRIKRSLEEGKLTKAPIEVVPIFVDIKAISEAVPRVSLAKKYPQFNFIILVASRLSSEKNIPLALEMMSRLIKKYPRVGLIIVGDGKEKNKLVSMVRKLDLERNVIFEHWQDDIISYYKTANMFLSTSEYEGYGLSMVEAVAAHCPTVATDAGVAPDLLHDGKSFVCPVGNAECLFNNVKLLIEDTSLRKRYEFESFDNLDKITFSSNDEYLNKYKESIKSAIS